MNRPVATERIRRLNDAPVRLQTGRYVLYWMQQSQRAEDNHALEYAILQANEYELPPLCVFCLTDDFPEANARHYAFLLEGLADVAAALRERGVPFVIRRGAAPEALAEFANHAAEIVTDVGYLRIQRAWRGEVAESAACRVTEVESDVVVPVRSAYGKEAYNAATLRRHISPQLDIFLRSPQRVEPLYSLDSVPAGEDLDKQSELLDFLSASQSVPPVAAFRGGSQEAERRLREFVGGALHRYDEERSDPSLAAVSHMSPYLHFGQISPLRIALAIRAADAAQAEKDAYLEELIVRRELAMNFCFYNQGYDSYGSALPSWAQESLAKHRDDERPYRYQRNTLESARTEDPYWNAAQREMISTGKMHNYMRMYWGKKILEWSETPERAFALALELNNKYELDGRDPNSFAGVAWCFGKHDRPWQERPVFGKIRYMNANGLRRKFDIETYAQAQHS